MVSHVYPFLLMACGWWTACRDERLAGRCGLAAMRMSLLAGMPVVIAGVLLGIGAIRLTFPGMSDVGAVPFAVAIAPSARLPEAWMWGAIGGRFRTRRVSAEQRA